MTEFPDTLPAKFSAWATMIPGRKPEFKVHSSEGLANSALGQKYPSRDLAKYRLINGIWNKVWEYRLPQFCGCGNRFGPVDGQRWRKWYNLPYRYEGKSIDQPVICAGCYDRQAQEYRDAERTKYERREYERLKGIYDA